MSLVIWKNNCTKYSSLIRKVFLPIKLYCIYVSNTYWMCFINVFGFLQFGILHYSLDHLRTERGFSSLFLTFSFIYYATNLFLIIKGRQEELHLTTQADPFQLEKSESSVSSLPLTYWDQLYTNNQHCICK